MTETKLKTRIPFRVDQNLYYPESDILIIGGNGLLAIINATKNYKTSAKIVNILDPGSFYNLALKRFNDHAFVSLFGDLKDFGLSGRLITYNLTTF